MANAFLAAARDGDLAALLRVLDPDVVLRAHAGDCPLWGPARGPRRRGGGKAGRRLREAARATGAGGARERDRRHRAIGPDGRPLSVLGISASGGKIVEIDILADPARLSRMRFEAP